MRSQRDYDSTVARIAGNLPEQHYWAAATGLIADELERLPAEEFDGRRMKMVAVLRNVAYRLGGAEAINAKEPAGVNGSLVPSPQDFRDEHGKHLFEDQGLEIVKAIKRDYAPDIDGNDGGQILAWILELVDEALSLHRPSIGRPGAPDRAVETKNQPHELPTR